MFFFVLAQLSYSSCMWISMKQNALCELCGIPFLHSIFQHWKPLTSKHHHHLCIPSFSIGSHLHQNSKTSSLSPKGIHLLFTNFPLVSVSQHNANSIVIFRHNIYFYQYNAPAFLSISLRFVDRQSFRAQPISCLDDPI